MIRNMKLNVYTILVAIFLLLAQALPVMASSYTVRPFLIDRVVEPRETVTETVQLTNDSPITKLVVYATVNEISVDKEGVIKQFVSPIMTDRTNTVTSWVEVSRGRIEIEPNSKTDVPLTFRINPYAKPGEYHVFVGFVPAPNRPKAESIALAGEADGVIVKLTVADKSSDSMKVSGFFINRFITNEAKKEISVVIENTGDTTSAPKGEIVFYDSKGAEVDSLFFNTEGIEIPPGKTVTIKSIVPVDGTLGRFKANLSLKYGKNQTASLFDSTSFFIMPINLLAILFFAILISTIFIVLLFKKAFHNAPYSDEESDLVTMYVKEGHDPKPQDHDIDLKNTKK